MDKISICMDRISVQKYGYDLHTYLCKKVWIESPYVWIGFLYKSMDRISILMDTISRKKT